MFRLGVLPAMFVGSLLVFTCGAAAGLGNDDARGAASPFPTGSGRVAGIVVDSDGAGVGSTEVFLCMAFVMERDAKGDYHHAPKLPANKPFDIFTPLEPKPVSVKTDAKGRFQFSGIGKGRYTIALRAKAGRPPSQGENQSLYNSDGVVAFDLADGQALDVGRVFEKAE